MTGGRARGGSRTSRRPPRSGSPADRRYTIDASVLVNAFNPHEKGHGASLELLAAIEERGDPVIVPTLLLPEIASAIARATGDDAGAIRYAVATASFPNLTLIPLSSGMAHEAAALAPVHGLRGADAVYLAVARRYGTTLVSRDRVQLAAGSAVARCVTPEEVLAGP